MHKGQLNIINTVQGALNPQSEMERKAACFDELLEALKEVVRWYGLRHYIPGTPLKDIEEQKTPIIKVMKAIAKAEAQ